MGWSLSALLLVAGGVILVSSGIEDAHHRTIANGKNAALALLAPAWWWANGLSPWPDMAIQFALAVAVFVPFAGAFALGWMGGGDVKMIGALALWLPLGAFANMLIMMSLAGGAITAILMIEARMRRRKDAIEVPYGIAIAMAALIALPGTVS
ncbi:MAG TPA: prepilin peptidase [Sphingomonas sp.]